MTSVNDLNMENPIPNMELPPPYTPTVTYNNHSTARFKPAGMKKTSITFGIFFTCCMLCLLSAVAAFDTAVRRVTALEMFLPSYQGPGLVLGILGLTGLVGIIFMCYSIFNLKYDGSKVKFCASFIVIFVVFTIVCGILVVMSFSSEDDHIEKGFYNGIRIYDPEKNATTAHLDYVQKNLKCCGVWNYTDWLENPYIKCMNPESNKTCSVPPSCCKEVNITATHISERGHLVSRNYKVTTGSRCGEGLLSPSQYAWKFHNDNVEDKIYTEGCMIKIDEEKQRTASKFTLITIGIITSEVFSIILSCFIDSWLKTKRRHQSTPSVSFNVEDELTRIHQLSSNGWIYI